MEIENHHVRHTFKRKIYRLATVLRKHDGVTGIAEHRAQQFAAPFAVIGEQDRGQTSMLPRTVTALGLGRSHRSYNCLHQRIPIQRLAQVLGRAAHRCPFFVEH